MLPCLAWKQVRPVVTALGPHCARSQLPSADATQSPFKETRELGLGGGARGGI